MPVCSAREATLLSAYDDEVPRRPEPQTQLELPPTQQEQGALLRNARDDGMVTCRVADGCQFFEDRPGKPGWILTRRDTLSQQMSPSVPASARRPAFVSFNVSFGLQPRLLLSYLRSHHGVGNATLRVKRKVHTLVGTHAPDSHAGGTSEVHTEFFQAVRFGVKPHAKDVEVRVEMEDEQRRSPWTAGSKSNGESKFKVVSLVAC